VYCTCNYRSFINLEKVIARSLLIFLFLFTQVALAENSQDENYLNRVHAHLLLKDPSAACEDALLGLQYNSSNKLLWQAYIKALAKKGDEKEMTAIWNKYTAVYFEDASNHDLIESMAWGVLENGSLSPSPIIRTMALLGAFFGQDAKGVNIMLRHLSDSNTFVRAAAVELSSNLHDAKLCEVMLPLFRREKSWPVHLELISALGKMKILAAKPDLLVIVSGSHTTAEEKAAAIEALVNMTETVERSEIAKLVKSDRSGLRLIACRLVTHLDLKNCLEDIYPLLKDHCAEVRAAALQAFGSLRVAEYQGYPILEHIAKMLNDPNAAVAITAAWTVALHDPLKGQQAFEKWLSHDSRDIRIAAAAALSACGRYGMPYMIRAFNEAHDPYVKMNLALGMISQRTEVDHACDVLCRGLTDETDRWTWQNNGMYRGLAPNTVKQTEAALNNPEEANQMVRLEIVNILAIMNYSSVEEALKRSLQQKTWGIASLASTLLLTEGDESAIAVVKKLLLDPNSKIRVQAALILAMWGRDESAIAVLQQAYAEADRELKERILEGIGRIGAQSSISFLVDKLQESYQSLRIIAACGILQCLYH